MPNLNLDFSGRDFTSNFEWLLSLLHQDVPELTDFNHSDAGISLIRLLSRETDQLNYYLDLAFAEGFLLTAKFKQTLIELGKLVDTFPKIACAATTTITVSRRANDIVYANQDDVISKGSQFFRSDGLIYTFLGDAVLPVGTQSIDIDVFQGQLVNLTIQPTDWPIVDRMGHPKFNLGPNVAARTISVSHNNGNSIWTEVESFYRSFPTDLNYKTELYADDYNGVLDTVFLTLGNGDHGSFIPNTPMNVSFIRTDGPQGNTGANTITTPDQNIAARVTCTNPTPATGGGYAEDQESFRKRLPYVVRTQHRGVTCEDYKTLVRSISGIADCQAVDRNQVPEYPWEYITIYVIPEGGGPLSDNLKAAILAQLMSIGALGGWQGRYILYNATPNVIPVSCRINITPGYSPATVQASLQNVIANQFAVTLGVVGGMLDFTALNVACSRCPGINWIEFDSPQSDVMMNYGEYPVMGLVSITVVP